AVSRVIADTTGAHDVWRINGQSVAEVAELQTKFKWTTGFAGQLPTHHGHFTWAGTDDYAVRAAGAHHLVRYLNVLRHLAPREPLSIIAHSHGCNLVKMASSDPNLSPAIHFHRAAFLACPHFEAKGHRGCVYSYRADPNRFSTILNLSSEQDTVQVGFADTLPGMPGCRLDDYLPPEAHRQDRDPRAAHLYDNWTLETESRGTEAHTVMHGAAVGFLVGRWLATGDDFQTVLRTGGNQLLPIRKGDTGE
ncbi:MAG: hypothetical protein HZA91_09125, partial [Verrucomicrobia bacterium]|nr:hypothetical protein [Verrucomicrobiota bacterium]